MSSRPKVFVSHAGEDWSRFVKGFATALREQGLQSWAAEWEIKPGDSLVDKIFEEGLSTADTVIVVVSEWSITKPWVTEELNYAKVQQVAKRVKLIPVIIDRCEIPAALLSTVYVRIDDLEQYNAPLNKIVASILGEDERPAMGEAPAYTAPAPYRFDGLTHTDNHILNLLCEMALARDRRLISFEKLVNAAKPLNLDSDQVEESARVLEEDGYVKIGSTISGPSHVTVQPWTIDAYCRASRDDYLAVEKQILTEIVNSAAGSTMAQITVPSDIPRAMSEAILNDWELRGMFRVDHEMGNGQVLLGRVSPKLRRALTGQ